MEQSSTIFCQHSHETVKNYTNSVTLPYVIEHDDDSLVSNGSNVFVHI